MATAVKAGATSWIDITPNITVKTYIMITVVLRAMMQNMELVRNIMSEDSMMQQLVRDLFVVGTPVRRAVRVRPGCASFPAEAPQLK